MFTKKKIKVNLFILGEQKCGTSSLHNLITKNQSVLQGYRKECQYFNSTKKDNDPNYHTYQSMFSPKWHKKYSYLIDSTPGYFSNNNVRDLIYDYNKNAKFILVFRNPYHRILSAYNFYFSNILNDIENIYQQYFKNSDAGMSTYSFLMEHKHANLSDIIEIELAKGSPLKLIEKSLYGKHLQYWLERFEKNQFLTLWFEDLTNINQQKEEIKKLEVFLDLKLPIDFPHRNKTENQKTEKINFQPRLIETINQDKMLLEKLINKTLPPMGK